MESTIDRGPGRRRELRAACCLLCGILIIYMMFVLCFGLSLTEHSPYDSYTLQAMAWREGRTTVDGPSHTWLELAVRGDDYYVSFPPLPSVILYPLTFAFGEETPSLLVNLAALLGTALFGYGLLRRLEQTPEWAAAEAFFYVCGCNLLAIMLKGGVWYIAQSFGMFFTTASLFAMQASPEKQGRASAVLGPLCIALAVGCRPFQAVYVPWVLYRLYRLKRREGERWMRTVGRMVPCVILPGLLALAYGGYNYVRFSNPLEFGHSYLPEFSTQGGVQFSLAHWPTNLRNIMRLPYFEDGRMRLYTHNGTAFYLSNPLYVISLIETVRRGVRRELDREDAILLASVLVHFNLLMLHRTFGGLQFGTRYLIDPLPAVLLLAFRRKERVEGWDALLMLLGLAMNAWCAVLLITF